MTVENQWLQQQAAPGIWESLKMRDPAKMVGFLLVSNLEPSKKGAVVRNVNHTAERRPVLGLSASL